jgi:hypothetical protein
MRLFKGNIVAIKFEVNPTVDPYKPFHGFGHRDIMDQGERGLLIREVLKRLGKLEPMVIACGLVNKRFKRSGKPSTTFRGLIKFQEKHRNHWL